MSTMEEWKELLDENNCQWEWYESGILETYCVAGYKVTSKKAGYTDKSIFLPAAGFVNSSNQQYEGKNGYYWSSSLHPDYPNRAYNVLISKDRREIPFLYRNCGRCIRPVCP